MSRSRVTGSVFDQLLGSPSTCLTSSAARLSGGRLTHRVSPTPEAPITLAANAMSRGRRCFGTTGGSERRRGSTVTLEAAALPPATEPTDAAGPTDAPGLVDAPGSASAADSPDAIGSAAVLGNVETDAVDATRSADAVAVASSPGPPPGVLETPGRAKRCFSGTFISNARRIF